MRSTMEVKFAPDAAESCADKIVDYFQRQEQITNPPVTYYPEKQNRYSLFGWNRYAQDCYTEKDVALVSAITAAHKPLGASDRYFQVNQESRLSGWWTCMKPTYHELLDKVGAGSFTLPVSAAKDAKTYPLWRLADSTAKRIANWQSERIKHQSSTLMNDPPMLALEELRDWFSTSLAEAECKPETLGMIAKRQSYLKSLFYQFPDFGPDRLRMSELQNTLADSLKIVTNCVASKDLPQLLTDVITAGKTFENTIGTYLHFLMVDEPVADNFLTMAPQVFDLVKTHETPEHSIYDLRLNKAMLSAIKFADFASSQDKHHYLNAMAALNILSQTRKTLEHFQDLQSKLGSYQFAVYSLEKANQLAENYIHLLESTHHAVLSMVTAAEQGLNHLLRRPQGAAKKVSYFEKNFRQLETNVAKGTTLTNQLDLYTKKTIDSMHAYQLALRKLATDVRTGQAAVEMDHAMKALLHDINHLNSVIPGFIQQQPIHVEQPLAIESSTTGPQIMSAVQSLPVCEQEMSILYGKWDDDVRFDAESHEPIFTYRAFNDQHEEVGSLVFYGQPILCRSADQQRHNLIEQTGVFQKLSIPADASIEEVCRALPPTLFDRVLVAAKDAGVHGAIRGSSNVLGMMLKSLGASPKVTLYMRHLSHYLGYFTYRFYSHYDASNDQDGSHFWEALSVAAVETGSMAVMSAVTSTISHCLTQLGELMAANDWQKSGHGVKFCGSLVNYGLFAYQAVRKSVAEAATSLVVGGGVEIAIESAGRHAFQGD